MRDRNRPPADRGLGTNSLPGADRALEDDLKAGIDRACLTGSSQSLFHLSQYLGFAHHHRLEARCDPEEVPQSLAPAKAVGVTPPALVIELVRPLAEGLQQPLRALIGRRERVQLGAIAGREQGAALDQVAVHEPLDAGSQCRLGHDGLLPDLYRGRFVAESDDDEIHPGLKLAHECISFLRRSPARTRRLWPAPGARCDPR